MKRYFACLAALAVLLGGCALAEPVRYESPEDGLAFDLPLGWESLHGYEATVFSAPDQSGFVVLLPPGRTVGKEEAFFPEIQQGVMAMLGTESQESLQTLFFAQAQGEDGKWYALASFGCMLGEVPHILSVYCFTRPDGALGELLALAVNNEKGMETMSWMDGVVQSHVPAETMARMMEQLNP